MLTSNVVNLSCMNTFTEFIVISKCIYMDFILICEKSFLSRRCQIIFIMSRVSLIDDHTGTFVYNENKFCFILCHR